MSYENWFFDGIRRDQDKPGTYEAWVDGSYLGSFPSARAAQAAVRRGRAKLNRKA